MSAQPKSRSELKNWIDSNLWWGIILPVGLLVAILFVVLVILINLSNRTSQDLFERQAEAQVLEVGSLLANQLEQELRAIEQLGQLLAHQVALKLQDDRPPQAGELSQVHKGEQGILYSADEDEAALYFSARQDRSLEKDAQRLVQFLRLSPLFKDIQASHELITQVYLNTPTTETLIYPWVDVQEQFAPDLDVRDFPFFYLADLTHNPSREPVWIDAYFDPAGQGWTLSLVVPVVIDGQLQAVVGVDLTLDSLVSRMLELEIPWKGYAMLMGREGELLAYPVEGEKHWGVSLRDRETSANEDKLNLLLRKDLRAELDPLRQDASGLLQLKLQDEDILLSWSSLETTGWKLLLVAPRDAIFSARQQLLEDYQLLFWLGTSSLLLGSSFFIFLSRRRDQRLWHRLLQEDDPDSQNSLTQEGASVETGHLFQLLPGPMLLARFDARDQLQACNTAFEHFAGASEEELRGRPLAPLLGLSSLPGDSWVKDLELESDQQQVKNWWTCVSRQEDQSGLVMLLDLTPYKLTQQQLLSERQRTRQAAKMKAEFSQVVAREAKSLLLELQEASQTVRNQDSSRSCREKIQSLLRLLDDLRDISEDTQVQEDLSEEKEKLDLHPWLDEVLASLDGEINQEGGVQVTFSEKLPAQFYTDRRRLTRLVRHLLRQSLQQAPARDLTLQLDWVAVSGSLKMTLLDKGGALADQERIKRFQASTPLGNNYEPAAGGFTLGPLLVRQLVQELKGRMDIQSRPEGGLEITLEIPVEAAVKQPSRPRILVVDDGPVNSMLASSVLEKSGFVVDVANTGRKALELGQQKSYALVLMDIFMPEMDGLEASRRWRQLPGKNAAIPLIALTANALESDREYFVEQGMDDYLAKPYRPDELRRMVDFWLKQQEV
ncbi:response regulator [Marinospirillum perlucidum]|uniref:response regulator n=1 Tax=Marinospirillum perlucidum TaxID=1982602 RepID=UPI00138FA513|nr:response regulator [Marinospirillum perlucidum]